MKFKMFKSGKDNGHDTWFKCFKYSFLIFSNKCCWYRVHTEMGKIEFQDFSRTIPGLFSFFKDSISSKFCIKQCEKMHFFSLKSQNKKAHSLSLILILLVIKTGTTTQIE